MLRISFILCSVWVASLSYASDVIVEKQQFKESMNNNVPVSGRVLTGIALSADNSSDFSINLPVDTVGENLCFRVISQDGTYSSENEYTVTNVGKEGFSSTDYPSAYTSALSHFSSQQLSLLASPGPCVNNSIEKVYISARGTVNSESEATFFVSSGRSDVFLRMPVEREKKKTIKCSRIEEGVRTAYDTLCKVKLSEFSKGINYLSIMRRKSGRTLPSYDFEVLVGH